MLTQAQPRTPQRSQAVLSEAQPDPLQTEPAPPQADFEPARLKHASSRRQSVIMIGFESSGKSALFRGLTGDDTGEEANFRGSTLMARRGRLTSAIDLVDLPGIRSSDDSRTTRTALEAVMDADIVILVVRATHVARELPLLLKSVDLTDKRVLLVLTFTDKIAADSAELEQYLANRLSIPFLAVDARRITLLDRSELLSLLTMAGTVGTETGEQLNIPIPAIGPQTTWLEHPIWGRALSLMLMILLFAVPVYLAYMLSSWLQPLVDQGVIGPLKEVFEGSPVLLHSFLVGDYGVLTLGLYSFLWAFPVVLLLGISVALVEESGLKDRITDSLDRPMRAIGLSGRDLIPVLSGFGCNVVAVFQSRACSQCTRKSCVSLIAFGSACSYQIGAALSVFGSAGHPGLFLPYIFVIGLVGALHTKVWNRAQDRLDVQTYQSLSYLQKPTMRAVSWRLRTVIKQFLLQAMPIFIVICLVAAGLQLTGLMSWLSAVARPLLQLLHLPSEAASGIIFSIIRKDGLLVLNQGEGELLQSMQAGQIFLLVYLASTFTACLVTLWTVRKEMGWSFAAALAGKQMITSLVSSVVIMLVAIYV
ncbi:ferrous iron transporter B [Paenibacillus campinasensis]|uniref:Ferrous iron transporter B n=1 Tax=Paenibacillus campinasensis TaxID=66347 RepID=A0ABW9T2N8_9BACL|nr:nucleoside recognition domain-containing protein [Paenibacillus campinasensis]MUG66380.1 ferrous iron transporter B [Paenibacillus campinasensis]